MPTPVDLPYRPCVGIALFNADGKVWIGRRADAPDDAEGEGAWWQMPQGGIDAGETPIGAATRELYEETSIQNARMIAHIPRPLAYDLPPALIGKAWGGRYRGQLQFWFAFRFEGRDSEIEIAHPGGGAHKAEFSQWRWEELTKTPDLVVAFKRPIYEEIVREFASIADAAALGWD